MGNTWRTSEIEALLEGHEHVVTIDRVFQNRQYLISGSRVISGNRINSPIGILKESTIHSFSKELPIINIREKRVR